jgi:hypothetical protein
MVASLVGGLGLWRYRASRKGKKIITAPTEVTPPSSPLE